MIFSLNRLVQVVLEEEGLGHRLLHADTDVIGAAFHDAVGHGLYVVQHHFECGHAPAADPGHKPLADDALEAVAQLELDQIALDGIEEADDAVYHFGGGVGV
jgi:hypothetical protein